MYENCDYMRMLHSQAFVWGCMSPMNPKSYSSQMYSQLILFLPNKAIGTYVL